MSTLLHISSHPIHQSLVGQAGLIGQDFELAFWQLTYLMVAPRRVYKQTYHQYVSLSLCQITWQERTDEDSKQTKNIWARDE